MAPELSLEALREEIDRLDEVIVRLLDRRARCAYAVGRLKRSEGMGIYEPAREASSYADVLNPADDNGHAEYFVLAGEAGVQVLVSVPHFSVHTVTLRERASTNGAYMYATFALGVVVIAVVLGLIVGTPLRIA